MMQNLVEFLPNEKVLFIVHRHWFKIFIIGKIDFLLFLGLIIILSIAESFLLSGGASLHPELIRTLLVFLGSAGGLFLWMHFFGAWTDHWLDVWIITDLRIIDVEQIGFLRREVASFPLDKIQDITFRARGIIQHLFRFGDVDMQTSSNTAHLVMKGIPYPREVKDKVVSAMEKHRYDHPR
jgi:hypothetical protein